MDATPVAGKTLRFRFDDGPMAGKTFEHVFEPSGAVRYRDVDGKGEGTTEKKYEAATIGTDVCAVSYLGSSGYTLTVVLDLRTKKLVAFSSNEKMHLMQHGTFEEVEASGAPARKGEGEPAPPPR
ncbi:MAG TPA: MoaF N-terminal domain-containing protein [Polyangiaceae bacterium]|jgi:hypothetical protein